MVIFRFSLYSVNERHGVVRISVVASCANHRISSGTGCQA